MLKKKQPTPLEKKIGELNPWYYSVDMGGGKRTMPGIGSKQDYNELTARQNYRYKMLVDPILERYDFKNKTILDVACNCGYWSSQYIKKGKAKILVGLEGRKQYVDQAYLYWGANNFLPIGLFGFIQMDLMEKNMWETIGVDEKFNFTLCAGILYHVSDYRWLLQRICDVTDEAILIDTRVSKDERKIEEPGGWYFDGVEKKVVKVNPSVDGMFNILKKNGFNDLEVIPNAGPVPPEMRANDNYETGGRVTILAKK